MLSVVMMLFIHFKCLLMHFSPEMPFRSFIHWKTGTVTLLILMSPNYANVVLLSLK